MKQLFSKTTRNLIALLVVTSLSLVMSDVRSQDRNPAAGVGSSDDAPDSDVDAILDAPDTPPVRQIDDTHPVVQAIRDSNPTTPAELINAAETMMNLGRMDLAQQYLDTLIAAGLDGPGMYLLHQQKGTPLFLELYRSRSLGVEVNDFAKQVLEAAYVESRAPNRLDTIVRDLSAPSQATRGRAMLDLQELGEEAVAPMLVALGDDSRADEHKVITRALYELGAAATDPLIGAMRSSNATVRQAAMEVLGRRKVQQATPTLVFLSVSPEASEFEQSTARNALNDIFGVSPSLGEAKIYLRDRLDAFLNGAVPGRVGLDDQVILWLWDDDPSVQASVPVALSTRLASLIVASDLAADLYLLDSSNIEIQRLYLSTLIETEKRSLGLDAPMDGMESLAVARDFGVERVEEVLEDAMSDGRPVTAAGAAELMGLLGSADLLNSDNGRPRLLVNALRQGDRRLQFAACMAINNIDPQEAFAGSNYFVDSLIHFMSSGGDRRILIGHNRLAEAQTLAASLSSMGYVCDIVDRGRDFFKMAGQHSDYEIVLISDTLQGPEANELVQQLRRDPRTSKLPIGLLARLETIDRARRIAHGDPLTLSMPWPYDDSAVQLTAMQLRSTLGMDFVDATQRLNQAEKALTSLVSLMEREDDLSFYDVRSREDHILKALYTPELTAEIARLLAISGSPKAQLELVNLASQPLFPLASRQAAVAAFAKAVEQRGVLLTSADVLRQYDRYNQSADLDRDTQIVLGAVLDILENKYQDQPTPDQ